MKVRKSESEPVGAGHRPTFPLSYLPTFCRTYNPTFQTK
jgi:hypothetical protein